MEMASQNEATWTKYVTYIDVYPLFPALLLTHFVRLYLQADCYSSSQVMEHESSLLCLQAWVRTPNELYFFEIHSTIVHF
jgi:hypothetical protein